MNENFTKKNSTLEQEAGWWLLVFDDIPDESFQGCKRQPLTISINKIKGFAKAYQPVFLLNSISDVIVN